MVRLADVNVKRFRKTWYISLSRLYNATMGYGYMVVAKEKKTIKQLNSKCFQEAAQNCAKFFLPPVTTSNASMRFEYPSKPYAISVLADAVERLGFAADVERFLNFSGFHISYFLSRHMPLEGAAAVVQNYSHYALDDALTVTTTHYDYHAGHLP
uniref:Uncharacterized protein n=1 Tax=Lygus hesperus TaxID=30085 RepID=A0A0A9WKI5_LYGHE